MKEYVRAALNDLKHLQDQLQGQSAGFAFITMGEFIVHGLDRVVANLETAEQIAEMKNDRGGNHDHS